MNHSPSRPLKILAHRGLVSETAPENTLAAFQAAMDADAEIIETDIWSTSDGVAVLFHDADFFRLTGSSVKISDISYADARQINLGAGQHVISLEDALLWFPNLKFNLDIKDRSAIKPTAKVVNHLRVQDRVLISSFSDARRRATVRLIDSTASRTVATSAGVSKVLCLWLTSWFFPTAWLRIIKGESTALQIPPRFGVFRLDSRWFIRRMHAVGLELQYWTINEIEEAARLIQLGADGLVTDRADLFISTLR